MSGGQGGDAAAAAAAACRHPPHYGPAVGWQCSVSLQVVQLGAHTVDSTRPVQQVRKLDLNIRSKWLQIDIGFHSIQV